MLLTSSVTIDSILLLLAGLVFLHFYYKRKYSFWKLRGIPYKKPLPFFGNFLDVFPSRKHIGIWVQELYDSTDTPYKGIYIFDEPVLLIKSPELARRILVTDFQHFYDRTVATPTHNRKMTYFLFLQKNPNWKILRSKLNKTFTTGRLKEMIQFMTKTGNDLSNYLKKNQGILEAKDLVLKYSTDTVSKAFFGVEAHSFEHEDGELYRVAKNIFGVNFRNGFSQAAYFFKRDWVRALHLEFVSNSCQDYISELIRNVLKQREGSNVKSHDFVDLVCELTKDEDFCKKIDFDAEVAAAPSIQFMAASHDTTSSTVAFTLYQFARNQSIQDKVRSEILEKITEHNGLNYEAIMDMKYLDICVKETLRMYPVLPFLDRRCNKDYQLPGTDVVIKKGQAVYIPMIGFHFDEKFYPDPKVYKPERFHQKMNAGGLMYYFPFGEGPRICIGERFGSLNSKSAIIHILRDHRVETCPQTPDEIDFDPKAIFLVSKVGLPLRFTPLSSCSDK